MRAEQATDPASSAPEDVAVQPIRGSGLLLAGRLISLGVTSLLQVLIVRHLSQTEYGAFAYALSLVVLLQSVTALGLHRSFTRFVAIYREQGDHGRLAGMIVLVCACIMITGTLLIGGVHLFAEPAGRLLQIEPEAVRLLAVLIVLVPLESLDVLLVGLFACLGHARAIFLRRHVLAPVLRLAAVGALIAVDADALLLAWGYLAVAAAGLALSAGPLFRACRDAGLLTGFGGGRLVIPVREAFGFTIPLLAADIAVAIMGSAGALVLGSFHGVREVALFAAVLPLAALNEVVMRNFALLYTPAAARLFTQGRKAALNHLYWQTALWIAVLTFPVFAVTFSVAPWLVALLYGEAYRPAGTLLAILSAGVYLQASLGFSLLTLRIVNRVRYIVLISFLSTALCVLANLVLARRYGALGAAVATSGSMVVHSLLKQAGLRLGTGVAFFEPRYVLFYATIGLCVGALGLGGWMAPGHPLVLLGLIGGASLLLLVLGRHALMVKHTFPELLRVPLLRALLT